MYGYKWIWCRNRLRLQVDLMQELTLDYWGFDGDVITEKCVMHKF